ncbi:MAG: hypothetical protein ABIO70_18315 [Pseudomonadota bacterium]
MSAPILALLATVAQARVDFEGESFYLGDLHAHTGISHDGGSSDLGACQGACGAFAEVFDIARDNSLDFVSLTEHVNGTWAATTEEFGAELEAIFAEGAAAGGLVILPGAELWFDVGGTGMGHKNLYLRASDAELAGLSVEDVRPNGPDPVVSDCAAIWDFAEQVEARWGPALLIPHHPAMPAGMGTEWACHRDERAEHFAPTVEVYSRHGNSEMCEPAFDPVWQPCDPLKAITAALDAGGNALHLGFLGGTDEHDTHPGGVCERETQMVQHPYGGGLTIAVLDEGATFDRAALFDAIAARSTYATSGPLLPVVVTFRTGGAEIGGLGQDLPVPEGDDLEVEVRLPSEHLAAVRRVVMVDPKEELELTSQGGGRFLGVLSGETRLAWVYVRVELDGEVWYGAGGCDDGGDDAQEYVWLSPSWLVLPEPDTGVVDDTGTHDSGGPLDSGDSGGDSTAPGDTQSPCPCEDDCDCHCECTCEERGCGLLGVSGLFALALTGLPLAFGRRRG